MRKVCIHGHFYQPPQEDPWSGRIEDQPSAAPYANWNERIADECYRRNGAAPILDASGRPRRVVDNYRHISFNFGPTLTSWFEASAPDILEQLRLADRASQERFSGHGSAIAQAWGHAILPLCNDRDRRTQVVWGLREFEHRFGRKSEGFWLPETAVDTATLETLAEHDVRYTILAPSQAAAVRYAGEEDWNAVDDGSIDTTRPYRCPLPSGRSIDLVFYDGARSSAIAFDGLLHSGEAFARRLLEGFYPLDEAQLVHVAVDGETFGHHHRHGEMALAHCIEILEQTEGVSLTCYGEFLDEHPPEDEVRIAENSAWSCPHELGRWQRDCGCASSPTQRQRWRLPLRSSLRWLRERIEPLWERRVSDGWAARDRWIDVLLGI